MKNNFADIADGNLRYFTIGMDSPKVEVSGDTASVTYTSVLNANAYGAKGTYRMKGLQPESVGDRSQ